MFLLALLACHDGSPQSPGTSEDDTAGAPVLAADACDAVAPGAPDTGDPFVALSHLHGAVRLFRPSRDWVAADQALVDALEGETWDPEAALDVYGPAVGGCVLDADAGLGFPLASVELVGDVAVVRPGGGDVLIPDGAAAVALDLRDLPAVPETEAAVATALQAILSGETSLGSAKLRVFTGLPDLSGSAGVYSADLEEVEWTVTGTAAAALPLAVLTDRTLAPEAARAAGALRLAGLGWIVGHPVWAEAAESDWGAVGDRGLAWPSRRMRYADEQWPDVIPADMLTDTPDGALDGLAGWGAPPPVDDASDREGMALRWSGESDAPLETLDRGSARAMLLVAHGLVDRFYPYFDVVDDTHDEALVASLAEVDTLAEGDRAGALRALGEFVHADQDGHGFFGDWAGTDYLDSYIALQIERIDGQPVVRASGYPEVLPGDTIVEIGGVPAEDWYADAMTWHSAATPGYLFEVSGRVWNSQVESADLVVRGADGEERGVSLAGMPYAEMQALVPWGGTLRPSGWLDDLGAPSVYFLNLNQAVTTTDEQWRTALAEAAGATGLVVDMRDYPAIDHYALAQALEVGAFSSATFRVPVWTGPDDETIDESSYTFTGDADYAGPIVLLVSNKTVSAAENFSMMLCGSDRVTVIGEPSAGTNGNITSAYLPGGYYLDFTGMRVLNPDGSELHGVGIPLDEEVVPTAADFAAGKDPELEAAIARLMGE
jgi:hypothetical protein